MDNPLLFGTFFLSIMGLLTRVLGFFYRIFLSHALGAKMLGVYQLIFPVFGICYTLFASGIQTSISRQVAAHSFPAQRKTAARFLSAGMILSVFSALLLGVILYFLSPVLARNFLMEPICAPSLKILALSFPFCGITSCINGYCYGIRKSFLPATSQLIEQLARILFLYLVSLLAVIACETAVFALVVGELFSCVYICVGLLILKKKEGKTTTLIPSVSFFQASHQLLSYATPLAANRLLINLLHSMENFLIPFTLRKFGASHDESLQIFGILNGMSFSFLMFPGTLTNSLSVLLLPTISKSSASGDTGALTKSISLSVRYSILLGVFSGIYFFFFGPWLGEIVFHEIRSGLYLRALSFLCPILYVSTTFSSILNGLGKTNLTFLSSVTSTLLRLIGIYVLIPRYSLYGYFLTLLVSQLFLVVFDCLLLKKQAAFHMDSRKCILVPCLLLLPLSFICSKLFTFLSEKTTLARLPLIMAVSGIYALLALAALYKGGMIEKIKKAETTDTVRFQPFSNSGE